jgi:hypothetical protein
MVFIGVKVVYYIIWVPDGLSTHFSIDTNDVQLTIYAKWLGYLVIFYIMDLIRITLVVSFCIFMHFTMKRKARAERLRLEGLESGSDV